MARHARRGTHMQPQEQPRFRCHVIDTTPPTAPSVTAAPPPHICMRMPSRRSPLQAYERTHPPRPWLTADSIAGQYLHPAPYSPRFSHNKSPPARRGSVRCFTKACVCCPIRIHKRTMKPLLGSTSWRMVPIQRPRPRCSLGFPRRAPAIAPAASLARACACPRFVPAKTTPTLRTHKPQPSTRPSHLCYPPLLPSLGRPKMLLSSTLSTLSPLTHTSLPRSLPAVSYPAALTRLRLPQRIPLDV
jgi:hypothetical protein